MKFLLLFLFSKLIQQSYEQTLSYDWDFRSGGAFWNQGSLSFYYDTVAAGITVTDAWYKEIVESTFGALFQGENVGCSTSPSNVLDTNIPYSIVMNVNVFDPVAKNTGPGGGPEPVRQVCIYIDNGQLCIESFLPFNSGNNKRKVDNNCMQTIGTGWNTIGVVIDDSGQTTATTFIRNEVNCAVTSAGPTKIGFDHVTSNKMFHCIGAGLVDTNNAGEYTAEFPFAGIISDFKTYENSAITSAWMTANTKCGAGCASNCKLCGTDGVCHYTYRSPELVKYDFTNSGPTWVSTHSDSLGGQTDFTLTQDWELVTPYYVDEQGLYFRPSSLMCNTGVITVGPWGCFSMGFWFKQTSPGLMLVLQDSSGTAYFSVSSTATGFDVEISGTTFSITMAITSATWYYALVTVEKVSPTQSQVCISMNYQRDNNCISTSQNVVYSDQASNKICLGGGYDGLIKTLDWFDMPLSNEEAKTLYKNGAACTVGTCSNCPTTGTCFADCTSDQYYDSATSSCVTCFFACSSCYEQTAFECFSCFNDLAASATQEFVYARTWCPACGDSYVYPTDGEECDDGLDAVTGLPLSGDGCSDTCIVEQQWICNPSFADIMGPSVCTFDCISSQNNYVYTGLILDYSAKPCDDGNYVEEDGCSTLCNVNDGWTCSGGTWANADTCIETCGDGLDYHTYPCDDGNLINGDGCDDTCQVEPYFTCSYGDYPFPDICTTICSAKPSDDGLFACSDNNISPLDGCNEYCEVEKGWECTGGQQGGTAGSPKIDTCFEVCGDSYDMGQYQCDDGNVNYLQLGVDGCSWNTCNVDNRYICTGANEYQRDKCQEICGDGVRYNTIWWNYLGASQCDDGNTRSGDGCDGQCRTERGWSCVGGTTTTPDVCSPICGDWAIFDDEFCDDGNTISGDGCDANCYKEVGMDCSGGYHYWDDKCSEICGDGRNVGYFICDDGNNYDGDGCSSTCTLEAGFQCTGGDAYNPDICTEVCGDGINYGSVQCDDGNKLNGDGCDQDCKIELGYQCTHPTNGKDSCSEICGDGIMLGFFQCDDGNNIENDGCSSTCTIEPCWHCDGLSPTMCQILPQNTIGFSNTILSNDEKTLTIGFNNSIVLQKGFDIYSAIQIEVNGPLYPYNMSWYLDKADKIYQGLLTSEFVIKLDWLDSQRLGSGQETLHVCFLNSTYLKHSSCVKFIEDSPCWNFPLGGAEHPASYCTELSFAQKGLYVVGAQLGLGLLISLGGHSAAGAWNTIYMLQFMHLIPVMNLNMPSCANYFFQEFSWLNLEDNSFGQYLNQTICQDTIASSMYSPTYNFNKMGFQTRFFMNNMADTFTFVAFIALIIPIVSVIKILLPKNVYLTNADIYVKSRFLIVIINLTYMKTCFLVFLNYFQFEPETASSSFNSFASIFGLIYVCLVPLYYLFQVVIFNRELRQLKKMMDQPEAQEHQHEQLTVQEKAQVLQQSFRAKGLFEEYHTDSIFQYGYMLSFTICRIAYAVVLTFYATQQDWQLYVLSIISISVTIYLMLTIIQNMAWIAIFNPYKYTFRNILAILNELALYFIFSTVAGFTRNDLFCCGNWRSLTSPLVTGVTYYLFAQASLWLIGQIYHFIHKDGKVSPLSEPIQEIPKPKVVNEEEEEEKKEQEKKKQDQKQIIEEEQKEEPKKQTKQQQFLEQERQQQKQQQQSIDESEISQSLRTKSFSQSRITEQESDDIETINNQTQNSQSQSQIRATEQDEDEDQSEESVDLSRDDTTEQNNQTFNSQNQTNLKSFNDSKEDDEVPQSSFQEVHY